MAEPIDAGKQQIGGRAIVNAPAAELFALVADPERHGELDGSGSVQRLIEGGGPMVVGQPFTMAMKMFGLPYKVTSTPTQVVEDALVEWRSGAGQRWRWEFRPLDDQRTEVSEFWDLRQMNPVMRTLVTMTGERRTNQRGILNSLQKLQERYRA